MGSLIGGDGTIRQRKRREMGKVEILAVLQAGGGTEITTPFSSSDPFLLLLLLCGSYWAR